MMPTTRRMSSAETGNVKDGGDAILDSLRKIGVDYIVSSPGSEWGPLWEALTKQKLQRVEKPGFLQCWHEGLATNIAAGYTLLTGRPQAVVLHTSVGPLQGAMAIDSARRNLIPMLVMAGESRSVGADPDLEIEPQWYAGVSTGTIDRFVVPITKWALDNKSPHTLHHNVIRAMEICVRHPQGPVFLGVSIEDMLHPWEPESYQRVVPPAPTTRALQEDIQLVAQELAKAKSPVIVTEHSGRDPECFNRLVELAEKFAIPVVGARTTFFANFPTTHDLWLGFGNSDAVAQADLVLLIGGRTPWYPPFRRPTSGTIVAFHSHPLHEDLSHQRLHADRYIEGDIATSLHLLSLAASAEARGSSPEIELRRQHVRRIHQDVLETNRTAQEEALVRAEIDAVALCRLIADTVPQDTIYVDETISHSSFIRQHLPIQHPQSYFRATGGLGQGFGVALGLKLAAPKRLVTLLVGDGCFLYNPVVQALGASREHKLAVLVVIFNNGSYAQMGRSHLFHYPNGAAAQSEQHYFGRAIDNPDYVRLAEAYDFEGYRAESPSQLKRQLLAAVQAVKLGKTAIVDVKLRA